MTEFVRLEASTFRMGSEDFYPEEGPVHEASVGSFEIAAHAVTNAEYAEFVEATGYRTVAERPLDPAEFPEAEDHAPGSLVFVPTPGPVDLRNWRAWWRWVPGASWRHPRGPGSDIADKADHPVVQIAFEDAVAYADWAGARLPTEVEWEYAARGGLDGARYAWGDEPNDGTRANSWQGRFPYLNTGARGWVYTAPVGSFPPNGFGLFEMTGNTWEWTATPWSSRHEVDEHCAPGAGLRHGGGHDAHGDHGDHGGHGGHGGHGEHGDASHDDHGSHGPAASYVTKGGSHLCAPEYCLRYRPAARTPQTPDSATTHLGFRLARDA